MNQVIQCKCGAVIDRELGYTAITWHKKTMNATKLGHTVVKFENVPHLEKCRCPPEEVQDPNQLSMF